MTLVETTSSFDRFVFIKRATDCINRTGGTILVFGVALAILNGFLGAINTLFGLRLPLIFDTVEKSRGRGTRATLNKARLQLGEITAFGLEILVVSDILETLDSPIHDYTYSLLGKIAAIASFRTFLAFVLSKEIEEIRHVIMAQEKLSKAKMATASDATTALSTKGTDDGDCAAVYLSPPF